MLAVVLAIVAAVAAGAAAERRFGDGARALARRVLDAMLYVFLPFVTFFVIAGLDFTTGVGVGIGVAYAELAIVGVLAWLIAARLLHLGRPATGALICTVVMVNTGYLGVPLSAAVLGRDAIGEAIAWDTLVSGPMFLVTGFAIGAAFGTAAGETRRERLRSFVARNPPLLALAAGLVAPRSLAPDALVDIAEVIVIGLLPVGFFVLGVNLAGESEQGAVRVPPPMTRALATSLALRLLVAPALVLLFSAVAVELPEAYLFQAAMPTGINSLLVAHAYGLDLGITAGAIAWSTTIAVAAAALGSAIA